MEWIVLSITRVMCCGLEYRMLYLYISYNVGNNKTSVSDLGVLHVVFGVFWNSSSNVGIPF